MEAAAENEDISEKFFKLCEGLEVGEMVKTERFSLHEVMSAIELMEPKMDVGVGSRHLKTLDDAITEGLYADDMPMQIAVMDATLAMVMAWLEGSSLSTTVWTNVMLARADYITQPTFHAFCAGVNLLVRNIYALINNVGNIEELPEDFNPQIRFNETCWRHRREVVQELRTHAAEMEQQGKNWFADTGSRRATEIASACCARLDLLSNFLDTLSWLVPPDIDDPNYDHKVFVGGRAPISEKEYEILASVTEKDLKGYKGDDKKDEGKKVEQSAVQKSGKKNKGKRNKKRGVLAARKNVLESVPEEKTPKDSPEKDDSPKDTPEKDSQKKGSPKSQKSTPPKKESPKNSSPKDQASEKESSEKTSTKEEAQKPKECCSGKHEEQLEHSTCDDEDCDDEDCDDEDEHVYYNSYPDFQPNFHAAQQYAERLVANAFIIKDTLRLGRRGPDDVDGDYHWLTPFDQKACIRMVPACFPRNVKYPTRAQSADWWMLLASRVHDLTRFPAKSTKDLNMLLFFAQQFNAKSCVLTRSLLQSIMFPVDNHILGGILTCAEPTEDSLKNNFMPQVLIKDSPVHDDPEAKKLYKEWLSQSSKTVITIYTSFGCNLTRQRDRLEQAIQEFSQANTHLL